MFKYVILLSIFLFLGASKGFTQKNVENQQLIWLRYNLKLKLNSAYQLNQELEERTYWLPWRQHQFLSRTRLERAINNQWKAALGFTYIEQSLPSDPNIKDYKNSTELRPQFEIFNKQKITTKFSLEQGYLSDFRFFEQDDGTFDYENIRARYKLELQYQLSEKVILKTFDEIFINVGGDNINVFEQNRFGGSIQYMTSQKLGFELGYFNSFQQRNTAFDFYNRNCVRFTVHHNINLNK